jgi:hypothetical protein
MEKPKITRTTTWKVQVKTNIPEALSKIDKVKALLEQLDTCLNELAQEGISIKLEAAKE